MTPADTCSFSGTGGGERQIYSRPLTTVREEERPMSLGVWPDFCYKCELLLFIVLKLSFVVTVVQEVSLAQSCL